MKNSKAFTISYAVILALYLIARVMHPDWEMAETVLKPLLMITLGEHFLYNTTLKGQKQNQFIFAAIVFSLIGDILLMNDQFFLFGLGAFLIAHVCYICAFQSEAARYFSKKQLFLPAVVVGIYGCFLLMQILPNIPTPLQKVPITVYGITISLMLLTVLHRFQNVSNTSFWYVTIGAILFVLSDSMIAINKFVAPFPMSGVLIMATYGIGQYLIVVGFLKKMRKN